MKTVLHRIGCLHRTHASRYAEGGGNSGQNRYHRLNDEFPSVLFHGLDSSFHLIF